MASRELRMPLSNVHLRGTSTETVPNANISGGSVVADLNGLAVKVRHCCAIRIGSSTRTLGGWHPEAAGH